MGAPMATTLSDVMAHVKLEANKGSSLDAVLPTMVHRAIMEIERNYSLRYMKRYVRFTIFAGSEEPGPYTQVQNCKSVIFVRVRNPRTTSGGYTYSDLDKVDPQDVYAVTTGPLSGYWLDGNQWMWFDAIPGEDVTAEVYYNMYSGRMEQTTAYWLFDYALDAVIAQSMMQLAPYIRSQQIGQMYNGMYQQAIRSLLLADEEQDRLDTDLRVGMLSYGT